MGKRDFAKKRTVPVPWDPHKAVINRKYRFTKAVQALINAREKHKKEKHTTGVLVSNNGKFEFLGPKGQSFYIEKEPTVAH